MDNLREAAEALKPGENISSDFSSYPAMVAKWRGSTPPPTEGEVLVKAAELATARDRVKYLQDRQEMILKNGVTTDAMIQALWANANGDKTEFDRLNVIIDDINAQFPKP